jgi:hypothetical protein
MAGEMKPNIRKNIALRLFAAADGLNDCVVAADPVNPYAFIITVEDKAFRVIVKELS